MAEQTVETAAKPAAKAKKVKYPTKNTLNLYAKKKRKIPPARLLSMTLVILLLAAALAKLGVYDRWQRVEAARNALSAQEAYMNELSQQAQQYDGVDEQYAQYTYSGMDAATLARADRLQILDLLETVVYPVAKVQNMELQENDMTLLISDITLKNANLLVSRLESSELVSAVKLTLSNSDETAGENKLLTASLTVTLAANTLLQSAGGIQG